MSKKKRRPSGPAPGTVLEVPIERLDDDGQGVGPSAGRMVAVQGALPGDVVSAEVTWSSAASAWSSARTVEVLQPSHERVENTCTHAPMCPGCPLRALNASRQLQEKRARLLRALEDAGLSSLRVDEIRPAPTALGYRSRAKYVVHNGMLGSYAPGSHDVQPTWGCEVVAPRISDVARVLQQLLHAGCPPALRYVVIRTNARGEVLVAFVVHEPGAADVRTLAEQLSARAPEITGIVEHHQPGGGDAIFSSDHPNATVLTGRGTLHEDVSGVDVEIGATAFTQLHPGAGQQLVAHVVESLQPLQGKAILDVYSGIGAFALAFRNARTVTAVDDSAEAIAAASDAVTRAGITNVRFVREDAARLMQQWEDAPPDAVVVDPPRKGLERGALDALIALHPSQLVYVACGPRALARDLVSLQEAGYAVERLTPFDLFPQTPEVESVAVLRWRGGNTAAGGA